jgi:hypothetical protein
VVGGPWDDASRNAMERSFRKGGMAFCTECGAKLVARRSGPEPAAQWILKCPLCERELRFPVRESHAPGS